MQSHLKQYDNLTTIYNYNTSEDCLFLNIWSPLKNVKARKNRWSDTKTTNELLPVIVYIHGGSFNFMGTSMEAYYGGIISSIGNVVFVTINYRLGIFGFFDSPPYKGYDKNLGLYDSILAIQWVHRNIRHFGGIYYHLTMLY